MKQTQQAYTKNFLLPKHYFEYRTEDHKVPKFTVIIIKYIGSSGVETSKNNDIINDLITSLIRASKSCLGG